MKTIIRIFQSAIPVIIGIALCGLCLLPVKAGSAEKTVRTDPGSGEHYSERISLIVNRLNKVEQPKALNVRKDSVKAGLFSPAFLNRAQHILDKYRNRTKSPGVAVALYSNGKSCFLFSGNNGRINPKPITPETGFAMGSIEKVFNSTLLALAIVQGKATIDDIAANYLLAADGSKVKRRAAFRKIILKNLVTHTSALPRKPPGSIQQRIGMLETNLYHNHPLPVSVMKFLNSWHPAYPPGTKYRYSNFAFILVGHAAVYLENVPYTRLLSDSLTRPLVMPHTGVICQSPAQGCTTAHDANGMPERRNPVTLWTSTRDMLHFVEANLGVIKLSPTLAHAIRLTHHELFRVDNDHAVGMAWEEWHHGDALLLSKDGLDAGFSSWVGMEPNRSCGVVVLRNGGKNPGPAKLGKKLLSIVPIQHHLQLLQKLKRNKP